MAMPFPLPPWLPWWVPLAVLVPVLLYVLIFLLMPFSVFGVKGRLALIEERLDDIQGELRALSLRLRARSAAVPSAEDGEDEAAFADAPPARRPRAPHERAEPRLGPPR
jgi:hypothetical protein